MKYPGIVLGFVIICQGLVAQKQKQTELPRPDLLMLNALDPPALEVEWSPVRHHDPKEPIIGYKVMVWEVTPVKTYKYEMLRGVQTLVEVNIPPKISDSLAAPEEEAKEIIVPGVLSTKVRVPNIKLNVIYEVRVRAFSARREGPLSTHMRVELLDDKKEPDTDNEVYITLGRKVAFTARYL